MWESIIKGPLIPKHQIEGEIVDKFDSLWTVEEKRKYEIDFKAKNFLVMTLDDSKLLYIYNCKTTKEIWDTLEMIYGVSPSIEQEEMNIRGKKDEDNILNSFESLEILKIIL